MGGALRARDFDPTGVDEGKADYTDEDIWKIEYRDETSGGSDLDLEDYERRTTRALS